MGSQVSKNIEQNKRLLNESKRFSKTNSDSNQSISNSERNGRKSSIDSDITPNYISSTAIQPIGSQSSVQTNWKSSTSGPRPGSKTVTIPAEIVVVSEGVAEESDQTITFPPLFKPIIPVGYESLSSSCPQINSQYVISCGLIVEQELRQKSELVAKQQNKLIERIKDIDIIVSHISNQFIIDRQKRLNKVSDNLSKIFEIKTLLEKCENDIICCSKSLEKLNNNLPESLCLEKFEFQTSG